jgi:predicted porin
MNKKLIALAVLGAVAAPAAMAQSANPVVLSGRMFVTVNNISAKGGGAPDAPTRFVVKDDSSFVRISGTEDLGGGLKAWFQVESNVTPDTGTGNWGNRNTGVGLRGNWGSFLLGRWDSLFKQTSLSVDPFGQLTIADPRVVISDKSNFNRRSANLVQYWSPDMAGLIVKLHYSANEAKTQTANPAEYGFNAHYTNGPFMIGYAWEKHESQLGSAVTAGVDEKGQQVVASATFGPVKLNLQSVVFKRNNGSGVLANSRSDVKGSQVNLVYTTGAHSFIGLYGRARGGLSGTAAAGAESPEGKQSSLGYYYDFSKRTRFVAVYTKVNNNSTANFGLGGSSAITDGPTIAVGQNIKGFGAGIQHLF